MFPLNKEQHFSALNSLYMQVSPLKQKLSLNVFNLFSYRVMYLLTSTFKEGIGVWYQEKYAEKRRQMIPQYSATCILASEHTNYSFLSDDNPLPQRITNFLLSVILLSQLLKQHLYILFFQRYSSRVTEGLIKGICYLSSYFILIFKTASTEGIKWEKNRPSFFYCSSVSIAPSVRNTP